MSDVKWGYKGDTSPEYWSSLCDEFSEAAQFNKQSPIDLTKATKVNNILEKTLVFDYQEQEFEQGIFNNSYHLVPLKKVNGVTFNKTYYSLVDVHVHFPSEHYVDENKNDFEIHFVHEDNKGNNLVIGILYNTAQEKFFIKNDEKRVLVEEKFGEGVNVTFSPEIFLPDDRSFYHYIGSLTTPPTKGPVLWIVMDHIQLTNEDLVKRMKREVPNGNCRPVQPLNEREVWHSC